MPLTIIKPLHTVKYKVSRPTEQTITVMAAVCRFDRNFSGGATAYTYMLRFFMTPAYTGSNTALYPTAGSFNASNWKDITPYYLDLVWDGNTKAITHVSGNNKFTIPYTDSVGIYSADLYGAYVYIEDSTFRPGGATDHNAEGDKVVSSQYTFYDEFTGNLGFQTESTHTNWAITADTLRIHKNLTTGRVPYADLCSQTSTFFDQYTISHFFVDEALCLSIHTGNSGRAAFTLCLNYENKKLFDTGKIWSKADFISGFYIYDKRLVYGFPNYENINKNNSATLWDGIYSVDGWAAAASPSGATAFSRLVNPTGYDKITGRLSLTGGALPAASLYCIKNNVGGSNPDISIIVNDFVFQEFDVHGRFGAYKSFQSVSQNVGHYCTIDRGYNYFNYIEYTANNTGCGVVVGTGETQFSATAYVGYAIGAVHNGFRCGLHSDGKIDTQGPGVIAPPINIQATFTRFMSDVYLFFTKNYTDPASITSSEMITYGKVVYAESLNSVAGWDFRLCIVDSAGNVGAADGPYYSKVFRYDEKRKNSSSLAGHHLLVTGNPGYSNKITDTQSRNELYLTSNSLYFSGMSFDSSPWYNMVKDLSFGAKRCVVTRDRLFAADTQYQEYQFAQISGEKYSDNKVVFFSPTGQFGGNFHLFGDTTLQIINRELPGVITGLTTITYAQGLDVTIQQNSVNLLLLTEYGYVFYDLQNNDEGNWFPASYSGDACVAPLSVLTQHGIAYYAGNSGVYMFAGQKQIDITELGSCKINKTWRTITRANKQKSIGGWNQDRKQYWLGVGSIIYVFDFTLGEIYTFDVSTCITFDERSTMYFIDNVMYVQAGNVLLKYDETATQDWNGSTLVNFGTQWRINNIKSDRWAKLNNFWLQYSSSNTVTVKPIIDYTGVSTPPAGTSYTITEAAGSNVFAERKIKRQFNSRGKRFSVDISTTQGTIEIFDFGMNITTKIPQKTATKGYLL